MRYTLGFALLAGVFAGFTASSTAQAAGFYIQEQSVSGLGSAFAGQAAMPRDASTVYFNPAGMTYLPGANLNVGVHVLAPSAELDDRGSTLGAGAVGGGDGGTVREVLRHKSVEKVVMVEIDKMVVDACMEHIPLTSSQLKDPKVELRYEDGVKYMAESKEQFDVIIVDSSDPIGPATPLFNESFYADVYSRLADDGIVVSQCESPVYEGAMQKTILKILSDKFNVVRIANYSNLTYPGSLWSFSMGSKKNDPLKDFQSERYDSDGLEFKYYNSKIHTGAFMLPEFQYKELKEFLTP